MSGWRERHHLDYEDDEYYWTGFGTDDGVDAIKDANAEMGLDPYNNAGFYAARRNGWLRRVKKDKDE